jgi:hypothetical protein
MRCDSDLMRRRRVRRVSPEEINVNQIRSTLSTSPAPRDTRFSAATVATVAFAALTALVTLTGCGGGPEGEGHIADGGTPPERLASTFEAWRESDYGPGDAPGSPTKKIERAGITAAESQTDRSATPVDRLAHTQRGHYVSRATAERTDQDSGGQVIWIDAGCCAGQEPELPERIVFGMQAVLGTDARIFVGGSDLRQAARLVDRFDRLGLGRVYLVTP